MPEPAHSSTADPDHGPGPRRRRVQIVGGVLIAYGVVGIVIFLIVASAVTRPLERARELSQSVEEQRAALVESLEQAETTIDAMADGVRRMDTSLADARVATDRSSTIARGVASSMFQLRDAMSIQVFGAQPLIGLASGFHQAGAQLELLAIDLVTIGGALDANRADTVTTASNLDTLAQSVHSLTEAVRTGPGVEIAESTLDAYRLAIFGVAGWLLLLALGCIAAGVYMLRLGRRPAAG